MSASPPLRGVPGRWSRVRQLTVGEVCPRPSSTRPAASLSNHARQICKLVNINKRRRRRPASHAVSLFRAGAALAIFRAAIARSEGALRMLTR